ncbi:MAG: 4-hydroxy-3-methylbut-2-enyl diphosphate reductase [archaeon]|nr:4-hydroxy-3-methylbut-2-enyl diphosphate reductase [archaeon]
MNIILGKTAGFCYGVNRAVNGLKEESSNCKVDCLGEIVHNESVCNNFKNNGVTFIKDVKDSKNKVVIRAHGVTKEVYKYLSDNNIPYRDLTCTNVLRVHELVKNCSEDYYIFLLGDKNHPEVIGTNSFAKHSTIINRVEDVENAILEYKKSKMHKLLIISQTTFNSSIFDKIVEIIKKVIKDDIVIKKTICNATELRQQETRELSKKVDLMIIVGSKTSSNTTKLYDIAKENCETQITLDGKDLVIDNPDITVGIMAGASTPKESIDEVINKLNSYKKKSK